MKRANVILLALLCVAGCSANGKDIWADRPGPKVIAYFPPLSSLAASVAGSDAQVQSLITLTGPHHYEPTTRDARKLHRADLFLTLGLGLDDGIAPKLAGSAGNPTLVTTPLGERLAKDTLREGGCECCKHEGHNHAHDPSKVEYDPHVWLGIAEAKAMANEIAIELSKLDPAHRAGYHARATTLVGQLQALEDEGRALLAAKTEKPKLITFHDSLFYFARSFGIEVVGSIEAPGQEPSAKKLTKLVETCKEHGVRLIAVEPQYPSNTSASALLHELKRHGIDAAFVEIDPMETADPSDLTSDYYLRTMRKNLANLAAVLK